jgi:hypothetical protein
MRHMEKVKVCMNFGNRMIASLGFLVYAYIIWFRFLIYILWLVNTLYSLNYL